MSRTDCLNWMTKNNYPTPPRSACTFCPYHVNEEWKNIKKNEEEWQEVVKIDKMIRNLNSKKSKYINNQMYLHYSCRPIDEINLKEDEAEQLGFDFGDTCEGMCGT